MAENDAAVAALPAGAAQLEQALAACLSADATSRAQGEEIAAEATKKGSKASLLAAVGVHSQSAHVRQMAFTLLKKNASKSWKRLGATSKAAVTSAPLACLERDPEPGPRRAAAACAGAIAREALPRNEWPALLPWAQASVTSTDPRRKEAALDLLAQLVDLVPSVMEQHGPALVAAATAALSSSAGVVSSGIPVDSLPEACAASARVASAALALLAAVVNALGDAASSSAVRAAFPQLLSSADRVLASGVAAAAAVDAAAAGDGAGDDVREAAEDLFATACDVAGDIVDSGSKLMGQAPIADVVAWCLGHAKGGPADAAGAAATSPAVVAATPPRARGPPLLILEALARARPKAFAKAGHSAAAAITALCELVAEPTVDANGAADDDGNDLGSDDSDDEGGDVPLSTLAAQALDSLALNLPSKVVLPAALSFVAAAAGAQQPRARRASMVVLLVIAEGCADGLRKSGGGGAQGDARPLLADAVAAVSAGLRDASSPGVRSQAAYALGQLAEHCQPEIASHVAAALPAALEALSLASGSGSGGGSTDGGGANKPLGKGAAQACYAIEVLLDAMDDDEAAGGEGSGDGKENEATAAAFGNSGGGKETTASSGSALVRGLLPSLVPSLVSVLARGTTETQHAALGALASAAVASGPAFAPHAPAVLPALSHFMQATGNGGANSSSSSAANQEALRLRSRATEAAGVVAACLGREGAAPLLNEMVPVMLAGFELDDAELREYTHGALANVAALLGPGAAPLLPRAVPAALASLAADDGACGESDDENEGAGAGSEKSPGGASHETLGSDEDEEDDDFDDSDDDDDSDVLAVRTGIAGEKAAAAAALGAYAAAAGGAAIAPHAADVLSALKKAAKHWHSDVREASYGAMGEVAKAAGAAAGPPTPPGGGSSPPAAHAAAAAEVLPLLAHALRTDGDPAAAAAAGGAAAEVVEVLGFAAAPFAEALSDAAGAILSGTARALGNFEDDDSDGDGATAGIIVGHHEEDDDVDGDEEEERGDAEALLLGAAADILPALARALGPEAFGPIFDAKHAGPLTERMGAPQPDDVRAAAVGAFADVALALGPRAAAHAAAAAPTLLRELRSASDLCRRNAAYAAGAAVSAAPEAFAPHAGHLLEALAPLLNPASPSSADPGVADNAAGALARSMLALPPSTLPYEAVVPALLSRVKPEGKSCCAGDPGEAEPIMRALSSVVAASTGSGGASPAVEPFVARAAAALAAAAADADAPPPVRVAAARGLVAAAHSRPDVAGPLVAALPEGVRAELEALAAQSG